MDIPISLRYKGRLVVYEAKNEEEKLLINELIAKKDYESLKRFIIQENEWEE